MTPFGRELEESMKPLDAMMSDLLVKRMTQATRPLSKRKWLVLDFDDQPFGPFFLADVIQFIGSRAITKDSPIYDEEEGKWNSASYTFEQISQLMSFDNYQLKRNDASIQRIDRVRVPDVRCAKDVIWSNIPDLEVSTDDSSYILYQENLVSTLDPQLSEFSLDSIGENDVMKLESILDFDDIELKFRETIEESRVELDVCGINMAFETLGVIDTIGMPEVDDEEYSCENMQVHGVKIGENVNLNEEVLMEFSCIELYGNHVGYDSRAVFQAMTSVKFFKLCVGYVNVEKCRMRGSCIRLHKMSMYKLVVGGIFCGILFSLLEVDRKMLVDKEWNFKKRKKILESLGSLLVLLEEKDGFREQKDAILKLDSSCTIDEDWVYVMELMPIQYFATLSTLLQFQLSNDALKIRRNFKKRKKKLQFVKVVLGDKDNLVGMVQSSSRTRILQPLVHEGTDFGRTHFIMKQLAYQNRTERVFQVRDWVFLKLHPFRQFTLLQQHSHNLSPKYCGPFQIVKRVGAVAYELKLPPAAKIHNVIHVGLLKKCWTKASNDPRVPSEIPGCLQQEEPSLYPVQVLDRKIVKHRSTGRTMWLIQWQGQSVTDATWEVAEEMLVRFPDFPFYS